MTTSILELFLYFYTRDWGSALLRTVIWLVYKVVCVAIMNIGTKIACYAMRDDFRSLLLIFMMVIIFVSFVRSLSVPE